jgi:hypothetical protein
MPCKKDNTRKYATRKGPPYHAKECKGAVKLGNDGLKYISSADKKGVYKWIKKTVKANKKNKNKTVKDKAVKGVKTYDIHDNFSVPFTAMISSKTKSIQVVENKTNKKIVDTKYTNIFIGDNTLNDSKYQKKGKDSKGNTILVEVSKHKYIYIGMEIYSFETSEDIKSYYSPIGNNDFPYPYAIGDNHTYFMLDKKTVPSELINSKKDGYGQFYGLITDKEINKKIQKEQKPFKSKLIHKRIFVV